MYVYHSTYPPESWLSAGSPLCISDEQMAACPPEAAQCRQVLPLVSWRSHEAPAFISTTTTSV